MLKLNHIDTNKATQKTSLKNSLAIFLVLYFFMLYSSHVKKRNEL